MFFPISHAHVSPIYLVVVGFVIGVLGGFFGVGGSFIAGPALRLVGIDWNFAVGTDLAHIVGKSVVAAKRHRALGNVDLHLGLIMALGTIVGAEMGAQLIQMLTRAGNVNFVVSIISIVIYVTISTFMMWESWKTLARQRRFPAGANSTALARKSDHSAFEHVTKAIQRWRIPPMISLRESSVTISRSSADYAADFLAAAPVTSGCRRWCMCLEFQPISRSAPICLKSSSQPATALFPTPSKATSIF